MIVMESQPDRVLDLAANECEGDTLGFDYSALRHGRLTGKAFRTRLESDGRVTPWASTAQSSAMESKLTGIVRVASKTTRGSTISFDYCALRQVTKGTR